MSSKQQQQQQHYYSNIPYSPLPPTTHQTVVVLTPYHNHHHRYVRRCLIFTISILLLAAAIFILYPSDPNLQLSRIHLNHIRVTDSPKFSLNLSFSLAIKVVNRDFYSLDYDTLVVSVGYRGRELGLVRSEGGKVKARGSSYVEATLDLDGIEVVHDVIYLIGDLARGVVPFDTVATTDGGLGFLFFQIPIQAKVSCEVYVNTKNQTIVRQDCHPE